MKVTKTLFEGLLVLEPKVHADSRGYFFESFNKESFRALGINFDCVQENQSQSGKNVIRGLHFQRPPFAQSKLVRVVSGRILDVVVDVRRNQSTYGQVFSIELSSAEQKQLLIPKGFAHGFAVLSDKAELVYGCDNYYSADHDGGILHNDPSLGIDWGIRPGDSIVSEKDMRLPPLSSQSFGF